MFRRKTQKNLMLRPGESHQLKYFGIIITVGKITKQGAEIIVGYPGLPNLFREIKFGGAILYETPEVGIVEVRAMEIHVSQYSSDTLRFLISKVQPGIGLMASAEPTSLKNTHFHPDEVKKLEKAW